MVGLSLPPQLRVCRRTYRTTLTVGPASSMSPGSRRVPLCGSAPQWRAAVAVTSAPARRTSITAWWKTCSVTRPTMLQWRPKMTPATARTAPRSRSSQVYKARDSYSTSDVKQTGMKRLLFKCCYLEFSFLIKTLKTV